VLSALQGTEQLGEKAWEAAGDLHVLGGQQRRRGLGHGIAQLWHGADGSVVREVVGGDGRRQGGDGCGDAGAGLRPVRRQQGRVDAEGGGRSSRAVASW
jgi:hypothetical protein